MPSKRTTTSLFSLTCGCKDSNSVSISPSTTTTTTTTTYSTAASSKLTTTTTNIPSSTSYELDLDSSSSPSTPSFSGLLRQLSDLENSLIQIKTGAVAEESRDHREPTIHHHHQQQQQQQQHHRRWRSDGGGGGGRAVEESVAVVKDSDDPLGDFRRSMLQMIVEKEIIDGEGLRELLRQFLCLNSPRHHDVILGAFAEIWSEVFEGYEDTPDLIRRSRSRSVPYRR